MLRRFQALWLTAFAACDIVLSAGTFMLAYYLRFHPPLSVWIPPPAEVPPPGQYLRLLPVLALVLLVSNHLQRLYTPRREGSLLPELGGILKATGLAVLLLTAFLFFERSFSYARGIVGIFAVLHPCAAFAFRAAVRWGLRFARKRGYNLRHVLVVGTGRTAQALIHRIHRNPWTGLRIVGLIGDRADRVGKTIHGIRVVGTIDELPGTLAEAKAQQVFIALPPNRAEEIEPLVRTLSEQMFDIRIVPDLGVL